MIIYTVEMNNGQDYYGVNNIGYYKRKDAQAYIDNMRKVMKPCSKKKFDWIIEKVEVQ